MSRRSDWLLEHQRNVYSQTGEDGIIETILEMLPNNDRWCVEFGAWDGLHLSNTRYLIEEKEYSAVLIEADKEKFKSLQSNYRHRNDVVTLNQFVGFTKADSLDHILGATSIPIDFDLLSIDIDGNDYHVWKACSQYQPKLVVIEFNPTIPTEVRFIQKPDAAINQGSSLLSIIDLANDKGYQLVSVLPFNAFFVRQDYYSIFQIPDNSPEVLRVNTDAVTYLFSGYDGRIFLHGYRKLPWHGLELIESQIQHLPRRLQAYPGTYSQVKKLVFWLFLMVRQPRIAIPKIRKRIGSMDSSFFRRIWQLIQPSP